MGATLSRTSGSGEGGGSGPKISGPEVLKSRPTDEKAVYTESRISRVSILGFIRISVNVRVDL